MAIVAKLKSSGIHVIVVGTGYGAFESARPGRILGDLIPSYQSGRLGMVAVATKTGEVAWCPSSEIEIVEIDGVAINEVLQGFRSAESAADLGYPVRTAEEVRGHPQFSAFIADNPDRQYLVDERIEVEFREWQCRRNLDSEAQTE